MTEIIINSKTSADIFSYRTSHDMLLLMHMCAVLVREYFSLFISPSFLSFFYISAGIDRIWLLVLFVTHFIACCWSLGKKQPCPSTKSHTIQTGRQPHISVFTEHWLFDGCVGIQQCVWYLSKAAAVPFFKSSNFLKNLMFINIQFWWIKIYTFYNYI